MMRTEENPEKNLKGIQWAALRKGQQTKKRKSLNVLRNNAATCFHVLIPESGL